MKGVQKIAKGIVLALKPDGVVLTQFNGAPAGQTVFHLHFHIIPRWSDRPVKAHGQGGMADVAVLRLLADRIVAELD